MLRNAALRGRGALLRLRELPRPWPFARLVARALVRRRPPRVGPADGALRDRLHSLPADALVVQRGSLDVDVTAALVQAAAGRPVVVERPAAADAAFAAWHRETIRRHLLPFVSIRRPAEIAAAPVVHEEPS